MMIGTWKMNAVIATFAFLTVFFLSLTAVLPERALLRAGIGFAVFFVASYGIRYLIYTALLKDDGTQLEDSPEQIEQRKQEEAETKENSPSSYQTERKEDPDFSEENAEATANVLKEMVNER
ncbi:hypothetical protein [Salsuginibacillus kocurii]|uniref:hypothetical protein n=1 Tax=Salsuginibacillus kocurii TaxID=427078 RepID=UPI00036EE323|nr:hypothetical protein [Salsuginibacillus kocurii]